MYVRSCFAGFDFIFDNFGVNAFALALYFPLIFFTATAAVGLRSLL